jgi:hypothetical protein
LVGFEYEYLLAMNINIELENWMYAAIASKSEDLGCTETEIVNQAIKLMLGTDESSLSRILDQLIDQKLDQKLGAKLQDLEKKLEQKLGNRPKSAAIDPKPFPITIRPLQLGDLVQIRDQSSPHFLEKLIIVKVGMLMATVETSTGEQSFLKRDLRFIDNQVPETLP